MIYFPQLTGKRILLVSHELSQTGAPLLLIETAHTLAKSGVQVILTNLGQRDPVFRMQTVEAFQIVPPEKSFIEADKADLIIVNTAVAKEWVRDLLVLYPGAGSKLIWWIHEMETEKYGRDMGILADARAVIFDSHASRRLWRETGLPMPANVRVIHPCIADDFLRAARRMRTSSAGSTSEVESQNRPSRELVRKRLRLSRDDFVLSLFGTYCLRKGQEHLIKTVGRMLVENSALRFKILLIGFRGTSERQAFLNGLSEVEARMLSKHRALRFVSDLKPYYLASDAFVMNTQDRGETFGRVTLEAMSFRLPVLGSDCGGTPEIVINGVTGLLHPAGDHGEPILAGNIRYLVNQRTQAAALGDAGFQRVLDHFTEARFYQQLAETFVSVNRNSGV